MTEGTATSPALPAVGHELKMMQLGERWVVMPAEGVTVNGAAVVASTIIAAGDKIELDGLVLSVSEHAVAAPAPPPAPPPPPPPAPPAPAASPAPAPAAPAPAHAAHDRGDPVKLADVASMVKKNGVDAIGLKFPILLSGGDRPLGENVSALVYPIATMHGRSRDKSAGDTERLGIGRSKENDIALDDDMVSKRHASLVLKDGIWSLVDEGSSNGTFVDGTKLERGRGVPVAGPLTTLRFGPKARLVLMDEPSFRAFLRSLLGNAVERKRFDTTRVKRATLLRDDRTAKIPLNRTKVDGDHMMPVTGVSEILDKVQLAPHDAQSYVVTLEDAIVEEFESWPELEAFVEGSSRRIVRIEAKTASGNKMVYLRP